MTDTVLLVFAQLLVGWLLADLLGGILHWLEDRVLTERMPIIGKWVVAPNRLHHRDPMAFTRASFVARNGTTWAAAGVLSLFWLASFGASWVWLAASIGGAVSSIVHYHAHLPPPPGQPWRVLQDIGIVQSPAEHARHHRPPSDRRYCVLTDWLNPLLDALGVWHRLERLCRLAKT